MFSHASKFLCYLVVGLQMAASLASAQGLMLCIHSDGMSQIENRAMHQKCADDQPKAKWELADAELIDSDVLGSSGSDCVDLPIANERAATLNSADHASAHAIHDPFLAILPPFLQLTLQASSTTLAPTSADDVPASVAVLDSLSTVILVI